MNDLIRTDTLFGKRVNLVGNISADLVLESLGKVYIKSRNKALTLEEFITSLVTGDPNVSTSRTLVVEGIEDLDTSGFKNGTFIFDKLSNILYIYLDEELIELINVAPEGTGYVKRSGDTMTGRLAIYVKDGPPLYVNSDKLVENLNAQYLNGETASSFTRRNKDERIGGKWTFTRPTIFEANTLFEKDIVANSSIGSQSFSSGFAGYGWRMDAETNTLTVDNLVVRKLMQVYELVVNKISATNGSLWITNAGKVVSALKLEIKNYEFFDSLSGNYSLEEHLKFTTGMPAGYAFIKLTTPLGTLNIAGINLSGPSGDNLVARNFWNIYTLLGAKLVIISNTDGNLQGEVFSNTQSDEYHIYSLFSSDFKFDCTFPIITRNNYSDYITRERLRLVLLELLSEYLVNGTPLQISDTLNALASIERYNFSDGITFVKTYYKYFGNGDFYLVNFDSDELPVFKPGDIIRCQKWTYNGIKYYDGVICNVFNNSYVIQLALSILDKKTTITYNESLNASYVNEWEDNINYDLYKQSIRTVSLKDTSPDSVAGEELLKEILIGLIEENDSIVLMGNLWDALRQNAVYITSTDNGAPFIDVLSGVNRPDYSVIYYIPIYTTIKLNKNGGGGRSMFNNTTIDIPYTGNYYVQKTPQNGTSSNYCDFTYIVDKSSGTSYMFRGCYIVNNDAFDIKYLNLCPDSNTRLGESTLNYYLLTESGGKIKLEDDLNPGYILLLEESDKMIISSTRTTKTRFGNLDGIQDETFPIDRLPYGYGLYGLNVFLTGEFYLNNGRAVADIGKDAIAFAIAAQQATNSAINQIYKDIDSASKILQNNINIFLTLVANDYYGKKALRSAGMRIANFDDPLNPGLTLPSIVLWGNYIMIATTQEEFDDPKHHEPTMLLHHGIIDANLIRLYEMHSKIGVGTPVYNTYIERYWVDEDELILEFKGNVYAHASWDTSHDNITSAILLDDPKYIQDPSGYDSDYHPMYVYMQTNGLLALTESEIARILETYNKYIWAINKEGDGYFARGNFAWDDTGSLTIKGLIVLGMNTDGEGNLVNNALLVLDSSDNTVLSIGNFSTSTYTDWLNTVPTLYWSIDSIITSAKLTILTKLDLNISSENFNLTLYVSNYYNNSGSTAIVSCKVVGYYIDGDSLLQDLELTATINIPYPLTLLYKTLTITKNNFANYTVPFTITLVLISIQNSIPAGSRGQYSLNIYVEDGYDYSGGGTSGGSGGNQATRYFILGHIALQSKVEQQTLFGSNFIGISPNENALFWIGQDYLISLKASPISGLPSIKVSGFKVAGNELLVCDNDTYSSSNLRSAVTDDNITVGTRFLYAIRGTEYAGILRDFYINAPEPDSNNLPPEIVVGKYVRTIHIGLDRTGQTGEHTWVRIIYPSDLPIGYSYTLVTNKTNTNTKYNIYIGRYNSLGSYLSLLEDLIYVDSNNPTQGSSMLLTNKTVGVLTFLGYLENAEKHVWRYENYATNN